MAKSGNITELWADGSDLGPPVCVSGADERVSSAPKMAERAPVPPDPMFLAYLERCHPVLHRIICRR